MLPGFLQLLNPLWTWALLAAAAVPFLAHLLSKRGGALAAFPAVRFIQQAAADCARWLRPRHWLLLLLRMLILALIALAFARPIWYRTAPPADASQGIITALVLDCSASMTRTHRGSTLFDYARQQVIEALRSFDPARDLATVIVLDAQPRSLLPEPTAGFSNLIAMVEALEPTQEQGDLDAALRLAVTQTSYSAPTSPGDDRRRAPRPVFVELYSDMQETQWTPLLPSQPPLGEASLILRSVGQFTANMALFAPRVNPVRPIAGQSATVSVEVANFSHDAVQPTVEMRHAGQTVRQVLRIPASSAISTSFTLTPVAPGAQVVELQLPDLRDSMPLDDRTAATFVVDGARPVALVTDAHADDPSRAAFFIARALRPERANDDGESVRLSGVALSMWTSAQLQGHLQAGGARPNIVVLCEAGRLSAAAAQALYEYLRQGGGVLWIADTPEAAQSLAMFSALTGANPLSPIVPDERPNWRPQAKLTIAGGQFDDPILAAFEGPSRSAIVNTRFEQVLAGRLPPSATPLLTFEDGTPALAVQWIGSGRLAVLGASLAPTHSELVKGPLLVPLLHQLLRHLTPGIPAQPNPPPGARPMLTVDGAWRADQLLAEDEKGRSLPITTSIESGTTLVQLERVGEVGLITVRRADDREMLAALQVELSAAESDMEPAQREELAAFTQPRMPALPGAVSQAGGARPAPLRPAGLELWPYLVAAALVFAAMETVAILAMGGATVVRLRRKGQGPWAMGQG